MPTNGSPAKADITIELGVEIPLRSGAALKGMVYKPKNQPGPFPVLLAGMRAPPNLGTDYRRAFDAMYPDLAKRYRVPLYPFFLDGVAGHPALIQGDGLHPNRQGVAIIVARMLPAVERALR